MVKVLHHALDSPSPSVTRVLGAPDAAQRDRANASHDPAAFRYTMRRTDALRPRREPAFSSVSCVACARLPSLHRRGATGATPTSRATSPRTARTATAPTASARAACRRSRASRRPISCARCRTSRPASTGDDHAAARQGLHDEQIDRRRLARRAKAVKEARHADSAKARS